MLRAFTPRDQSRQGYSPNQPKVGLDIETAITELAG
jgi:hypothetical protein